MRSNQLSFIFYATIFFILFSITINSYTMKYKFDYYNYLIDGFEIPGEWQVKFSKYRSRKWQKNEISNNSNKKWYNWFLADEKKFTNKQLFPDFVIINQKLIPEQKTILGIRVRWDVQSYNYIDVIPVQLKKDDSKKKRYGPNKKGRYPDQMIALDSLKTDQYKYYDDGSYILLPGKTKEISVYVWSSNHSQQLEFHIEDAKGNLYTLNAGNLNFIGWKRVSVQIPNYIIQRQNKIPRSQPLKFKRLRFIFNPHEKKSRKTYIYLDYLHAKTKLFSDDNFIGDGLEISDLIWEKNSAIK